MPISKSRIRFQGRKKKAKQGDGEKAQRKLVMIVHVSDSDSTLVDAEPLFVKKRLPFTEELDNLLRSNLSISLAAAKGSTAEHNTIMSLPVGQSQDEFDEPPASLLELAPIYRPINDRLEQTSGCITDDGHVDEDNETPAWLLATIEASVSVDEGDEPVMQPPAAVTSQPVEGHFKRANLCTAVNQYEYNDPPTSLFATADLFIPVGDHVESVVRASIFAPAAADNESLYASLLLATRKSFIDFVKPVIRSSKVPLQHLKDQPTFLQRVVTLFTGRRHHPTISEKPPNPTKSQQQLSSPLSNPPSSPRPRRAANHFDTTPRKPKNPPLPNPVLNANHPYRPVKEHLDAPFIEPAKPHKYTGDYSIAPDVFGPAEIQLGFISPTSPVSPTFANRRLNSAAMLLDRDKSTWGKWYTKMSKPESLPFSKMCSVGENVDQLTEETTEQQAWDAHATSLGQTRRGNNEHTSNIEATEQEAATRLRNHSGHCFGAVTGDVYPFQHGLIL